MTDYTVIRSRRRTMALEVTREGRTAAHQTSLSIRIVFPPMTLAISVSL